MQDQHKLGLFLDVPRRRAIFGDSLNIILAIQSGICGFAGVFVLGWPAIVRNHMTDLATAKCERLAGCGLTDGLFQINGGFHLCCSYLAILALRIKDLDAKRAIAKFFLSLYLVTSFMIIRDKNAGIYNDLVFAMFLPWMLIMSLLYFLVIRVSRPKKDPRSPEPRYPRNGNLLVTSYIHVTQSVVKVQLHSMVYASLKALSTVACGVALS